MSEFSMIYDGLNAAYAALEAPPKPQRAELEVWRDAQGVQWFQYDGEAWMVGHVSTPPDVREACIKRHIELERSGV